MTVGAGPPVMHPRLSCRPRTSRAPSPETVPPASRCRRIVNLCPFASECSHPIRPSSNAAKVQHHLQKHHLARNPGPQFLNSFGLTMCSLCSSGPFMGEAGLLAHQRSCRQVQTVHSTPAASTPLLPVTPSVSAYPLACAGCQACFSSATLLGKHLRSRSDCLSASSDSFINRAQLAPCPRCSLVFSLGRGLTAHLHSCSSELLRPLPPSPSPPPPLFLPHSSLAPIKPASSRLLQPFASHSSRSPVSFSSLASHCLSTSQPTSSLLFRQCSASRWIQLLSVCYF